MKNLCVLLSLLFLLSACNSSARETQVTTAPKETYPTVTSRFSGTLPDYWYQGKAEINTYDLQQVRYGEVHPGVATLIFVSEDFLPGPQVKNDRYANPNSTPIIKTNQIRRFTTGIYDYSVMSSVFTPTKTSQFPHSLKVTTSSQDWCGQSFGQFNYQGGDVWKAQLRSYFEAEGDQTVTLNGDWLEDEIFNRLRIDPRGLPIGEQMVVPALSYLLLTHQPLVAVKAVTKLDAYQGSDFNVANLQEYSLNFPSLNREVSIVFQPEPPYTIEGWTETFPSRGRELTTVAKLKKQVLEPYWEQNRPEFVAQRKELGLSGFTN